MQMVDRAAKVKKLSSRENVQKVALCNANKYKGFFGFAHMAAKSVF